MLSVGRQLFWTAQSCLRTSNTQSLPRFFSSSPVTEAYKMKSHSGSRKRWRSLASGSAFKRGKVGHQHLNVSKSAGRKNKLSTTAYATSSQAHKLKKVLLPYGTV